MSAWERSELLIGKEAMERLAAAHVAVFGVGGVGGYAVEALARAGVGRLTLVDSDTVAQSNLNRQIIATHETIGCKKVEVAKRRVLSIHPQAQVTPLDLFYLPENADSVPLEGFDYIIDAIDTMSAKIELIVRAGQAGVPIISAMGCGNKLDPTAFTVTDLYQTDTDPLARVLRRELRRRGVTALRVVYSTEPARKVESPAQADGDATVRRRQTPGSMSYVPGVAGLILGGEVIRALAGV